MKKLSNQVLGVLILSFLIFLICRIYLNNLFVEGGIFLVAIIICQLLISKSSGSIQALTDAIREGMINNSFELNLEDIKDATLKKIGEEINNYLKNIYDSYIWKQGVVDEIPMCAIICDEDNRIIYVNQEIIDFVQQDGKPEDFVGMTAAEFFYGDPNHPTITGRAFKEQKKITGVRVEVTGRKGKKVFTEINAAPFYDPNGKLIGSFAIFADLSELKAEQEKTAHQAEILKKAVIEAKELSEQLTAMSEEFTNQITAVNSSMEELRGRTDEVATAMDEMNSTVLEVSKNAAQAAEAAENTAKKAQEGTNALDKAISLLTEVQKKAKNLQSHMEEMEKQAEGIGEIINTISDIADQTNLLALNAAIEAARAGDAGKGFAVVADEVRKLAEKTMTATKNVEEYIHTIQNSAKTNMMSTREVAEAIEHNMEISYEAKQLLDEMVRLSTESMDQIRSIATAAEEQSAASEQITKSTEEINQISQDTTEIMERTSSSTEQLTMMIQQLNQMIANMDIENE
ncbi:methyl-accepting chemotaxis protein [Desulfothermus sp.]